MKCSLISNLKKKNTYRKINLPAQRISPPLTALTGKRAPTQRLNENATQVPRKRDGFRVTALCARKNIAAADFVEVPRKRNANLTYDE